jgi:hypothetical protein
VAVRRVFVSNFLISPRHLDLCFQAKSTLSPFLLSAVNKKEVNTTRACPFFSSVRKWQRTAGWQRLKENDRAARSDAGPPGHADPLGYSLGHY